MGAEMFASTLLDELSERGESDAWYDLDVLDSMTRVYGDFIQWARAMSLARRQNIDTRTYTALIRRLRSSTLPLPERVALDDLLKNRTTKPKYVVNDLLPLNGLSILAGGPKAGKSTLSRFMMFSIAQGAPVLKRNTMQGACLYYVLEEKLDEVVAEFARLGASGLPIHIRCGRLPPGSFVPTLRKDVTETGAVFVVADPMFDTLDVDDSNDYNEINTAMKELVDTVRALPCHVTMVHHTNKSGVRSATSILGSRAFEGATDTNLMVERRDDDKRLIWSQQRYGKKLDLSYLVLDENTRRVRIEPRRVLK